MLLTTFSLRRLPLRGAMLISNYVRQFPFCSLHYRPQRFFFLKSSNTPVQRNLSLEDWKPVYRFRRIILARIIQRLKIYQTGFTCFILLPGSIAATSYGFADVKTVYIALGASILACMMLLVMGTMSSRIIGFVYLNKVDPTKIRVARLSFFGSRVDTIHPINKFSPLTDSSENMGDAYVVLQTTNDETDTEKKDDNLILRFLRDSFPDVMEDKYYISLRYGEILDTQGFNAIFGDTSLL